jgi:hypothetical protein
LIATTNPVPTLEGVSVFSSIQPLKTFPNPPSPNKLSVLKFLVAVFKSAKVNSFKLGVSKIFPLGYNSSTPPVPSPSENRLFPVLLLMVPDADDPMFLLPLLDATKKLKTVDDQMEKLQARWKEYVKIALNCTWSGC